MTKPVTLIDFVRESNHIEKIHREPTQMEMHAHERFLEEPEITVSVLESFVTAVQPGAILRRLQGLDVRVGFHFLPPGGPDIETDLYLLLLSMRSRGRRLTPYEMHIAYETLHPFTDGNGRSGRVLWLWMMGGVVKPELFLESFYSKTLRSRDHE